MSDQEDNPVYIPERGVLDKLRPHKRYAGLLETLEHHATSVPGGFWYDREDWENLRRDYGLARMRGAGDVVGRVATKLGVKKCPDPENKCKKRRRNLNQAIPFKK